jgi:P-type conjugative transfer protein TrbJ
MSRRFFLMSGSTVASVAVIPPVKAALFGVCTGVCADMWEQLVQIANQIKKYATQVMQYYTEVQTYINTAFAVVSLPSQVFSGVLGDISLVRGLASAASLLTGNAGSIISRLEAAGGYLGTLAMSPTMVTNQFTMWSNTLGNAADKLGHLLDTSGNDNLATAGKQASAEVASTTALGTTAAVQAGNQLISLTASTLQQVHQAITGFAQEVASRDVTLAERQAMEDSANQEFLNHVSTFWTVPEKY